jgi:hypothetical protein
MSRFKHCRDFTLRMCVVVLQFVSFICLSPPLLIDIRNKHLTHRAKHHDKRNKFILLMNSSWGRLSSLDTNRMRSRPKSKVSEILNWRQYQNDNSTSQLYAYILRHCLYHWENNALQDAVDAASGCVELGKKDAGSLDGVDGILNDCNQRLDDRSKEVQNSSDLCGDQLENICNC